MNHFGRITIIVLALLILTLLESSSAFVSQAPIPFLHTTTRTYSTTSQHAVEIVNDEDRVLDVATFRNGVVNPEMMVQRAEEKRGSIDTTKAAFDGLKIGLLYIGPAAAVATYLENNDVTAAALNYGVLGGGVGALLAANNFMGKGVHVPTIPEAKNRIIVDFAEGLLRKQDVGFVALSDLPFFEPSHGVMGTVDVQLRNSSDSPSGVRNVSGYPPHVHIKNMLVHHTVRRQGVGQALIEAVVNYAKNDTDAEMLTLEVELTNPAAINLYRKNGFEERQNPNKMSRNYFMVKQL